MIFVASPFGMNLIAFNKLYLSNKLAKDVNVSLLSFVRFAYSLALGSHKKSIKQSRKKTPPPLMGENSVTIFAV